MYIEGRSYSFITSRSLGAKRINFIPCIFFDGVEIMKQTKVIENVGLLPFTTTILFHSIHRDNNILVYIAKKDY